MKKTLMIAASALVLGAAAPAFANDLDSSIARGLNDGTVNTNESMVQDGTNGQAITDHSFQGAKGVFSVDQTAGTNNLTQTATALGAVLNCDCGDSNSSLSVARNDGLSDTNSASAMGVSNSQSIAGYSFAGAVGVFSVSASAGANNLVQTSTTVAATIK
jgi:hypothetical protein